MRKYPPDDATVHQTIGGTPLVYWRPRHAQRRCSLMTAVLRHVRGVVLAAGKGTRMKSDLAKVLHLVAGVPMVNRVLAALRAAGVHESIVIVGHQADAVKAAVDQRVTFVEQREQLGTAHAVMQAAPFLQDFHGDLIVMNGDTPLIRPETIKALLHAKAALRADAMILTAEVEDPTGYGRIVRSVEGWVVNIVEEAEAAPEEKAIREINAGVYVFSTEGFFDALTKIPKSPRKGEYYLTDMIKRWTAQGRRVGAMVADDAQETLGVDTPERLQQAAARWTGEAPR